MNPTEFFTEWVGRMLKEHGHADKMKVTEINPESGSVTIYCARTKTYSKVAFIVMPLDPEERP